MRRRNVVGTAVLVHVAFSVGHGLAHAAIPVHVPAWQYAYAGVVILGTPLAGAILVAAGRSRAGLGLLVVAALAALAFEGLFHFLVVNPDHVSTVASGRTLFATTAALTTLGDLTLLVAAGWALWRGRTVGTARAGRTTAR